MSLKDSFRHPRYQVLELLGEGGMGEVYLAEDVLSPGARVALKVYPAHYHAESLRSEFLALKRLRHPAIARAEHFGVTRSDELRLPFFTMEYIEGQSLDTYCESAAAPCESAAAPCESAAAPCESAAKSSDTQRRNGRHLVVKLLDQVADAVSYLHRRGVLHLDLKPGNIMVVDWRGQSAPQPVLIDFGLVREAAAPAAPISLGTLPYAAPELFQGEPPTPATDVYSLGATFYTIFAGRHPLDGTEAQDVARAHRERRPVAPLNLERGLAGVIERALLRDPGKRFRDASEFQHAWHQAALRCAPSSSAPAAKKIDQKRTVPFYELPFVGRKRELDRVERWLAKGRVVKPLLAVTGSSGGGKTRFLEEIELRIETLGRDVVPLRCNQDGGESFLDECLADFRRLQLTAPPERGLRSRSSANGPPSAAARHSGSLDLHDRAHLYVQHVLPLIGSETFVLIDDLDLAGREGWLFVTALVRGLRLRHTPFHGGIVVTLRTGDELADEDITEVVPLGPLSRNECLDLEIVVADTSLELPSSARLVDVKKELYREVGGHPLLYVQGILDALSGGSRAERRPLAERLASQVTALHRRDRELAATLAALERAVSRQELSQIVSESIGDLKQSVETLRRRGLVTVNGHYVRIVHESIREAIVAHADQRSLSERHRRIAKSFGRSSSSALEAAWHCRAGQDGDEALRHLDTWIKKRPPPAPWAFDRAVDLLSWAAELRGVDCSAGQSYLEAQGDLFDAAARYEECFASRKRLAKHLGLIADAASGNEKRPRSRGRRSLAPDAGRRSGELTANQLRCRRKLASACHRTGRDDLASRYLLDCLTPGAENVDPVEVVHAHAEMSLLKHFRGEADDALRHSQSGIRVWQSSPRRVQQRALQNAINLFGIAGQIRIRRLELIQAIEALEDGLRLAERAKAKTNSAVLLNNLALAHHLAGHLDVALSTFRRAEKIAKELGDAGALASIRANVAQILAKRGQFSSSRDILDDLERDPAVRQSKRQRLSFLYSVGLYHNLLRQPADGVWEEVTQLADDQSDIFLRDFARLYRAEELMFTGDYDAAKRQIAATKPRPQRRATTKALQNARLALIEAFSGNRKRARQLVNGAARIHDQLPALLAAWNSLYLGMANIELEAPQKALQHLKAANKVFSKSGFIVGQLETLLALADGQLRIAADDRRQLDAANRCLKKARLLSLTTPQNRPARQLEVRLALLEARHALTSLVARPPSTAGAPSLDTVLEQVDGLLTRAGGDPDLTVDPDLRRQLGLLATAARRLSGSCLSGNRLSGSDAESKVESGPSRKVASGRHPWKRFGLDFLMPPATKRGLTAKHAQSLHEILRRSESVPQGLPEVDDVVAAATRAIAEAIDPLWIVVRIQGQDKPVIWNAVSTGVAKKGAAKTGISKKSGARDEAAVFSLAGSVCRDPSGVRLTLLARSRNGARFTAGDERHLDAATQALLLRLSRGEARSLEAQRKSADSPTAASKADTTPTKSRIDTVDLRKSRRRTQDLVRFLRAQGFIAEGRAMLKVVRTMAALARSDLSVMITGESGSGKDCAARALHSLSPRSDAPFVCQNASSIPSELFEADLFGYERGAFTGAENTHTGFLFRAVDGTFHLEEISDLDNGLQKSLLSVIEHKAVRPLGATSQRQLNVRFITSTHRNIDVLVQRGQFRSDLFYRLSAGRIDLPPLRQRNDEMAALLGYHWEALTGVTKRFPQALVRAFSEHDWPGNVRELVSVLRRLHLEATTDLPSVDSVHAVLGHQMTSQPFSASIFADKRFEDLQQALEEAYLEHLLARYNGDLEEIARALKTTTRSVYRRFERLGLKPKNLRAKKQR